MAAAKSGMGILAKLGVGLVALALTGVTYFIMFYGDIDKEMSAIAAQESKLRGDLQKAKESKDAYQKDLDLKAKAEEKKGDQKKMLPDEAETPAFLTDLQDTATTASVNLTAYTPLDEIPLDFYSKVPMSLKLTGKFHQIVKFFHGVGQRDRIINIENITMKAPSKPPEKDDDLVVNVDCLATAFRALDKTKPGADSSSSRQRGKK